MLYVLFVPPTLTMMHLCNARTGRPWLGDFNSLVVDYFTP